jgi:RND superfamily putative drug exporter
MTGLARWCIRHKNLVLFSWIAVLVALGGVVGVAGSAFSDSSRLPASDSTTVYNLLAGVGSDAAKVTTGTILWHTDSGSALSRAASSRISPMLASVARVEGVKGVISPFRSAWAAVLPIITGVAGVGVSILAVSLLSHVITLPSVAPELGALIGLGVGIDYALFIVNRHRKALRQGAGLPSAITTAMNTSGRAVLFAGGTVIAALLGLLVLNVGFLTGLGISAAVTVFLTVMAAATLLPALLAKMGRRVLRKSERATTGPLALAGAGAATDAAPASSGVWARWGRMVERRPVVSGVLAVAVLATLAAPALAIRLGAADSSSAPTGTSARSYYDTMANAFGKGFDAQLLLVAKTPDSQARTAWTTLTKELPDVKGVAAVGTPTAVSGNSLSMIQVVPTTAAQDQATSNLVHTLRSDLVTRAEAGTDLRVYVGGTTATNIDFANALTSKLPLFLAIIAVLGFLLLTLAFRSLLVPAIGAVGNLLTIAVALGSTVALFQWGWGPSLFGIGGPAPLEYIVAILIVGVVFGLSMDYHVFLVSRMHERWTQTGDNGRAVTGGVADTGGVIITAAAIMACVFASFGIAGVRTISEFGVGLAVAVLADAFLLRMTVVPALMCLIGDRNWAIPSWLDRVLPHVSVESPATNSPVHPAGEHREPAAVNAP